MAPPMAAMIFLFGVGPVPGIGPGTNSPNRVEPVELPPTCWPPPPRR